MQQVGNTTAQIGRKDELIGLLEAESSNKAERIAQYEEQLSALRKETSEMRAQLATVVGERDALLNKSEDYESQLETSESLRKEADEREARMQEQYDELALALNATEAQRRSGLVTARAEEVMKRVRELEDAVVDAKSEVDTLSLELGSKDGKIEKLTNDLHKLEGNKTSAQEQVSLLREELLTRTRELKDLTLAHEALHREQRQVLDKLGRVEEVLAQKEEHVEVSLAGLVLIIGLRVT
jgi:chromosome segregation ATPase